MKLADSLEKRTTALTVAEVAKVLNVSIRQVYSLAASNKIPHIKIGGCIRFDPTEFAAWVRQRMITAIVPSVVRTQKNRQSATSRSSQSAIGTSATRPQIAVPITINSNRKPSSKVRPANQQQYRFAFGQIDTLPMGTSGQ
jgi:excisionase family DNA binding protein